jgi:site-specific DNA-methyltransferase (adenine-specific)
MLELNKIYCIDNVEGMKMLEDNSIDLTVTSPPYDNLRTYKGFTWDFKSVVKQLYRVTKLGGIVVWIVGDSIIKGSESGTSFRQALYFKKMGFSLHDTMIYEKAGNLPAKNRYVQSFEYMFILSKGKPKIINIIKDRKNNWGGHKTFGKSSFRNRDGSLSVGKQREIAEYGSRMNIWRYANGFGFGQSDKEVYGHPATFPEKLANDHIISWSNENDIILDPFMGSGTTAKMAKVNKRNFIGFEISQEYCDIANKRLSNMEE